MSNQDISKQDNKFLQVIARIEDGMLVFMLAAMIVLAGMQIILRNAFQMGFTETDSLLRVLVLWVGMIGAVVATRERRHIAIDVLTRYLSDKSNHYVEVIINLFVVAVCGLLATHSMRMLLVDYAEGTIAFSKVPTWLLESILPIAFTIITLRYVMFSWLAASKLLKDKPGT